jgi:hypothetical protein
MEGDSMKGFLTALSLLVSVNVWAAADPASIFVSRTLMSGKQIMELKSEDDRKEQMCALLQNKVHSGYIATHWLGKFKDLKRDAEAVVEFRRMIPSILMTTAITNGGNSAFEGKFKVSNKATKRGNGYFAIDVQVKTDRKNYNGKVIVLEQKGVYRMVDVEYFGFSGVDYMGRDYQRILKEKYNRNPKRSMPVSELIADIKNENNFIDCSRKLTQP